MRHPSTTATLWTLKQGLIYFVLHRDLLLEMQTGCFDLLGLDLNAGIVARLSDTPVPERYYYRDIKGKAPIGCITRCRGTCKALTAAAGSHVKALRCYDECDIPAGTWVSFPNAIELVIVRRSIGTWTDPDKL